jgi:hypothetical protein
MGNLTGVNVRDGHAQKIWWGAILLPFFPLGTVIGLPLLISGIRERARNHSTSIGATRRARAKTKAGRIVGFAVGWLIAAVLAQAINTGGTMPLALWLVAVAFIPLAWPLPLAGFFIGWLLDKELGRLPQRPADERRSCGST